MTGREARPDRAYGPLSPAGDVPRPSLRPREPVAENGSYGFPFVYDDGGRAAAGFRGETGDCVTRAIAIATGLPYRYVYDELAIRSAQSGQARSARNGVAPKIYRRYLEADLGWLWTPTMRIGSGCTVHLRVDELPDGDPLIVRLSRHLTAVIGGAVRDTYDPGRDGTRCVYGYWRPT